MEQYVGKYYVPISGFTCISATEQYRKGLSKGTCEYNESNNYTPDYMH